MESLANYWCINVTDCTVFDLSLFSVDYPLQAEMELAAMGIEALDWSESDAEFIEAAKLAGKRTSVVGQSQ